MAEGGGHLFLLDHTAESAAAIREFLGAEPAGAGQGCLRRLLGRRRWKDASKDVR